MDAEETHQDAPKDKNLYTHAIKMMTAFCDVFHHAKECCQPIESENFESTVFTAFENAVNESGYTEERGYEAPARTWQVYLQRKGI